MVLPKSGDGVNVINSKEYWKPDLFVSKLEILYKMIDRDAKSSVKYITDTSKWLYTNIDGTKVFAIYSVENISKPTLLYECKGKQATFERERLIDLLEELDDGKDTIGRADIISEILSGNWVQKIGSLAYNARSGGRTRGNSDVRVLPTPSKRKPSGAFISVIKNLFEIEERTKRGNVKSTVKTADSDLSNDDILFSLSEPVEETKNLVAVSKYENENIIVKLKVDEFKAEKNPTKRFYNLNNIEIPSAGIEGSTPLTGTDGNESEISDINTVSDLFSLVKTYDKDFKPKPNSLVLNEDGTPKVMYRGDAEEFTVFDRKNLNTAIYMEEDFILRIAKLTQCSMAMQESFI